MAKSCRFVRGEDGRMKEVLFNGKPSKLFADILALPNIANDKEAAAGLVATIDSPAFDAKALEWAAKDRAQFGVSVKVDKSGVNTATNIQELAAINQQIFGLDVDKAKASAIIADRMVGVMAKRAGISKAEMYKRIKFKKEEFDKLPEGALKQLSVWHGSPYRFDKFSLDKIGTGEGAQAFGWGLYFTDAEDIAKWYADKLARHHSKLKIEWGGKSIVVNHATKYLYPDTVKKATSIEEATAITLAFAHQEAFTKLHKLNEGKPTTPVSASDITYTGNARDARNVIKEFQFNGQTYFIESIGSNRYEITRYGLYKFTTIVKSDKYIRFPYRQQKPGGVWVLNNVEEFKSDVASILEDVFKQAESDLIVKEAIKLAAFYDTTKTDLYNNIVKTLKGITAPISVEEVSGDRHLYNVRVDKASSELAWLDYRAVTKEDLAKIREQLIKEHPNYIPDRVSERFPDRWIGDPQLGTGQNVYQSLIDILGTDKEASLFLLRAGFTGIKYPAEQGKRSKFNYVVFDDSAISIEEVIKFQRNLEKAQGAAMVGVDGQAVIYALTDPNVSTPLHEMAHVYEHYLKADERNVVLKAAGTSTWTTETSEYFARGFEKYLAEGKTNVKGLEQIFNSFKQWLLDIYKAITGSDIDVQLNDEMRKIYADMLGHEPLNISDTQDVEILDENGEYRLDWILKHTTLIPTNPLEIKKRAYTAQLANKTKAQKDVADKLLVMQDVIADPDDKGYVHKQTGTLLTRVTDSLKEDEYYGYFGPKSDEDLFELNKKWGNAVDAILSSVVLGEPVDTSVTDVLSDDVVRFLQEKFKSIMTLYPDHLFLTQVKTFNLDKKVAGTADLVMISPSGKVRVIDLKTSKYPFRQAYQTDSGRYSKYDKQNQRDGKPTASRKERHSAQVSSYAAMFEAMGISLEDDAVYVLPMHITKQEDGIITYLEHDVYDKEQPFIPLTYVAAIQQKYFKDTHLEISKSVIDRALKSLKEHVLNAQKAGTRLVHLETLISDIETAVDTEKVIKFINNAYTVFVERLAKDYLKDIKANWNNPDQDAVELLNKLDDIRKLIDIYHGNNSILKDMARLYRDLKNLEPGYRPEPGSPLDKLDITLRVIEDIQADIDDNAPRTIAKILAKQVHTGTREAIQRRIAEKEAKLTKLPQDSRLRVKLAKELAEDKERYFIDEKGNPDIESMIEHEIRQGGYKDISAADRFLSPAVSMNNSFLATFVLTLKEAFERARQAARDFLYVAHEEFEKYAATTNVSRDNPNEFYKGMYKTRTLFKKEGAVKNVLSFVAPIDYTLFEQNRQKMYAQAEKIENAEARSKFIDDWYSANTQIRPKQHIEGVTRVNGVSLINTVSEQILEMKERFGEPTTNAMLDRQIATDGKGNILTATWKSGFLIPNISKYADADFKKLSGAKLNFYTFMMKTYLEAQKRQPARYREDYKFIAPFVKKSAFDRAWKDGKFWKAAKDQLWDEALFRLDEDYQTEGLEDTKTIPILFYNAAHSMDVDDTSLDLMASVMKYNIASLRYEQQSKHASLADNLLQSVRQAQPAATDSAGFRILSKAAASVGITGLDKYVKKHGDNHAVAMLEAFIDTQIYGHTRKDPTVKVFGRTVDIGKVADSIIGFSSKTQIALDWSLGLANSLQARVNAQIEAVAGQYFNKRDWFEAGNEYTKNIPDLTRDTFNPVSKSKLGQLIDLYDAMQGDFNNEYGHALSKSALKHKFNTSLMYTAMKSGEHHIQTTALIALLKSTKVKDAEGKEISLYDAYVFDKASNKLTLKPGVEFTEDQRIALQNRLHAINKRMHGVYNSFDKAEIERYWWGRLLIMYKKWLVPGLKRRFKSEGLDYELGDMTTGMYTTFFRKLFEEYGEFARYVTGREHTFTDMEVAAIRRTMYEFGVIAFTGALAIILTALASGTEPEKKWKYQWPLYFAMRLNAELSVYGGLGDPSSFFLPNFREVLSPYRSIPALNVMQKAINVYTSASGDLINLAVNGDVVRYQRDTGIFEKGDWKTGANLLKLIGISGKSLDPDLAIDVITLQKGTNVTVIGKTTE